jgi:hypothetical protein
MKQEMASPKRQKEKGKRINGKFNNMGSDYENK